MQKITSANDLQEKMLARAKELLAAGTIHRVFGWKKGLFDYDVTPAVFESIKELEKNFVYNEYCAANLSKYLIQENTKEGNILAFLKPNDTYSFNQLLKEHRVKREKTYIIGVPCNDEMKSNDDGSVHIDAEPCQYCVGKTHVVHDELIGVKNQAADKEAQNATRFNRVSELESKQPDDRFNFWRSQLSKCIRCNACRNVCPACSCIQCVFDNPNLGVDQRVASNSFEENQFHIIRAYHVAGRCTDCGECSRVCPENIPLHLLNRKIIKDINELYGEYQAGTEPEGNSPLQDYQKDDAEPSIVFKRSEACEIGGKK
ncbi:MAG TPA: 4Fe-4S dicluster domain-containing protein [Treponemataceae bacterium]|nr:4Fe-4S dicluster domain-containing protein [Treponemataceae bacterium]